MEFRGRVSARVNGPAGYCRTSTTALGVPLPTFDFKGGRKCSCSPTEGITTVAPVRGSESGPLSASVRVTGDSTHWLRYEIRILSPHEIPVNVSLDVARIGRVQVPLRVPLPAESITGHAPPFFDRSGRVNAGLAGLSKEYRIAVRPRSLKTDQTGVAVTADAEIEWR